MHGFEIFYVVTVWILLTPTINAQREDDWIVNKPHDWFEFDRNYNMYDDDSQDRSIFISAANKSSFYHDGGTDKVFIDAVEHFFWGKKFGVALELGAVDGTPEKHSVTFFFEELNWKRILIEGNPEHR
jgi:hypothetical protein